LQDFDVVESNSGYFVGDLGERSFVSLAVRMSAYPYLQVAIRRQPCDRRFVTRHHGPSPACEHACPMGALLAKNRQSNPDEPPI
jgi:hypothetical protein